MSSTSYYLRGSTDVGQPFILVEVFNSIVYFLNIQSDAQGNMVVVFDPTIPSDMNKTQSLTQFTVSGSPNFLSLIGTNGNIALDSNNKPIVTNGNPTPIMAIQNMFNEWGIFLAGVEYSFSTTNGVPIAWTALLGDPGTLVNGVPTGYLTTGTGTIVTTTFTTMHAVPMNWFLKGMCNFGPANDITIVVPSELGWALNNANYSFPPQGFLDQNDCTNGLPFYSYCPVGVDCARNCKSPCNSYIDTCTFDQQSNSFGCQFNPFQGQWWKSPIFIIIVVAIIVLFLGILIALIYAFIRR